MAGQGRIDIEILVVPDCPTAGAARELVEAILVEEGLSACVTTTVISTHPEAQERGFVGSPTVLVNGVDPFGEEGGDVGVACRLYRTPVGLSGMPDHDRLTHAILAAAPGEQQWKGTEHEP